MVTVKFFRSVTTYGEALGQGWYWKTPSTDWVGPFEDAAAAVEDSRDFE
jgi:hypothetical protein